MYKFFNNNNSNNYQLQIVKAKIIYKKSRIKLVKIDIICFYMKTIKLIYINKNLVPYFFIYLKKII